MTDGIHHEMLTGKIQPKRPAHASARSLEDRRFVSLGIVLAAILLFCATLRGQMIAEISEDVATDFGTYHPCPAVFSPKIPSYTVKPDFGDVDRFWELAGIFGFTTRDSVLLAQNHFTVKPSAYRQMTDIYNACTWNAVPVFVTTDAVLQIEHVLFDRILARMESLRFFSTLDTLTEALLDRSSELYESSSQPAAREALRRNMAFLGVTRRLLKGETAGVPDCVAALVDSETALISLAEGFAPSPLFGSAYFPMVFDYSLFQPRGHYTRSDTLASYFLAMTWLGSTIFSMETDIFGPLAERHTLQALLLVQMLDGLRIEGRSGFDLWNALYQPTVFFVGKTDDPSVPAYLSLADSVFGSGFQTMSPDSLSRSGLLGAFMDRACQLPEPEIPNCIYGSFITFKGFRFMGQRYIPDSHLFSHLVFPDVPDRFMPRGLDLMAVLGSDRAYALLDSVYSETQYLNLTASVFGWRQTFSDWPSSQWAENLYWNRLYILMPLLFPKTGGYPMFMQHTAWSDKELLTALAAWTELRHDAILYAKQSSTPCCIPPGPPRSYAEPNPLLYARLAALVQYLREGLEGFGLLENSDQDKLNLFESYLLFLRDVSIRELEDIPLTETDHSNLFCFGKVMEALTATVNDPGNPWSSDSDRMPIVADVHTDQNSGTCLEEGVGNPLEVFVIVRENGSTRLARGAMFSQYEFTMPISERLTDEAWVAMCDSESPPAMPEWTIAFTDPASPCPEPSSYSPNNLFDGEFTGIEQSVPVVRPAGLSLEPNHPNPFNGRTTLSFRLAEPGTVVLTVFDVLGRISRTLFIGASAAGEHSIVWDGRDDQGQDVSSGIYLVRLSSGGASRMVRILLLR